MISAENAVRRKALTVLASDAGLAAIVHGIFDGTPPRITAPYVTIGAAEGRDWGTKDRAGREVRLTLTLVGVGSAMDDIAAARVEAAAAALRGAADGWSVAASRVVRTRFAFGRDGGWRHDVVVRCRCLAG